MEGSVCQRKGASRRMASVFVTDPVISWIRPFLDISILMVYDITLELLTEIRSRRLPNMTFFCGLHHCVGLTGMREAERNITVLGQ